MTDVNNALEQVQRASAQLVATATGDEIDHALLGQAHVELATALTALAESITATHQPPPASDAPYAGPRDLSQAPTKVSESRKVRHRVVQLDLR